MELNMIIEGARRAAGLAAKYIHSQIGRVAEKQIIEKDFNSLVSYVDQTAEKIIVEELMPLISNAGFLTEEDTVDQLASEYVWVIDPLDGTTNFLMGIPHFAVSIALQYKGDTIIGVVQEVNSGEEFYASKSNGAYLNDKQIRITPVKKLSDVCIATGFPYTNEYDVDVYLNVLKDILTKTRGLRRMGSAALDLCDVACGRFGAYYESRLNPWDIAAGALIVSEANGIVTDFSGGNEYGSGREIVACAPQFHRDILEMLKGIRNR